MPRADRGRRRGWWARTSTKPRRRAPPNPWRSVAPARRRRCGGRSPTVSARWWTGAGRIDVLFNNAGITWSGDTELLTLDRWNAIIDVNIRGVVHGVAAAYPVMVKQGHGHIVNTASMAGLAAAGRGITSYVMTKHAVVGGCRWRCAPRPPAAGSGCWAGLPDLAVETPILDKGAARRRVRRPRFLPDGPAQHHIRLRRRPGRRHPRAIERNKALLVWLPAGRGWRGGSPVRAGIVIAHVDRVRRQTACGTGLSAPGGLPPSLRSPRGSSPVASLAPGPSPRRSFFLPRAVFLRRFARPDQPRQDRQRTGDHQRPHSPTR